MSTAGADTQAGAPEIALVPGMNQLMDPTPIGAVAGSSRPYYTHWWKFTAPGTVEVQFDTFDTTAASGWSPDTLLTVTRAVDGSYVAFNDDTSGHGYLSSASMTLVAGEDVYVRVGTYDSSGDGISNLMLRATVLSSSTPASPKTPKIRSHGILYNNGPSRMDVFLNTPTVEPGDTVLFIVGGGNQVTGTTSDLTWLSDVDGQEAQGSIFKTEAEGYVNPSFWFDGGDPQRVLYVVFRGETGLQVVESARDGVAGSTLGPSTLDFAMTNPATTLGIYYCFDRNASDNPTLSGPGITTLDTYQQTATHTARAWIGTGSDQASTLSLPSRSGHYHAIVRAFPYKYTYAYTDGYAEHRYSSHASTGSGIQDHESASGHVRQFGSYYEPTTGDVSAAYAAMDASKLEDHGAFSGPAGVHYYADYDADLFGGGRDSYWYADHYRSVWTVSISVVPGIQTGGTIYWNPNFMNESDKPPGYIRWEWDDDGDRWNSRLIPVTGAEEKFEITKYGHDNTNGTDVDRTADYTLYYMVQSDGGVTFTGPEGNAAAWTSFNPTVVRTLETGSYTVNIFPYLNSDHRAIVFADVQAPYLTPVYPPSQRNVAGNWELEYGSMNRNGIAWTDGESWQGSGDIRWSFTAPLVRWVMSMEEDDGSVVVTGEEGRLRVLVDSAAADEDARWKFFSPAPGENGGYGVGKVLVSVDPPVWEALP